MSIVFAARQPCDEALAARERARRCAERAKPWILGAAVLGSSLALIEGSVVGIALPAIQSDLGASTPQLQWILNIYLLFLSALMLSAGAASDLYGHRRMFIAGVGLFTLGALGSGLAPGVPSLLGARALQGLGAAILVPTSLALIGRWFPAAERGRAIGTWAGLSALTTALGPTLGGLVVDLLSWRWAFFLVVPLAVVTIIIALARVPADAKTEARPQALDWPGAALATSGLAALSFALIGAGEAGWRDASILGALAAGIALLAVFVAHEHRAAAPMMPLGLFKRRGFAAANGMTVLLYFALAGVLFFLPFNLIQVQGYSATAAGAALLPFTMAMALLSRVAGALLGRIDARWFLGGGPLVAAIGCALLTRPVAGGAYWPDFFPPLLLIGVGMSLAVAPLTTVVLASVDEQDTGKASGINNTAARAAGLFAIAVLGALTIDAFATDLAEAAARIELPVASRDLLLERADQLGGLAVPQAWPAALRDQVDSLIDAAFLGAFARTMWICAALAALSGLFGASIRCQ